MAGRLLQMKTFSNSFFFSGCVFCDSLVLLYPNDMIVFWFSNRSGTKVKMGIGTALQAGRFVLTAITQWYCYFSFIFVERYFHAVVTCAWGVGKRYFCFSLNISLFVFSWLWGEKGIGVAVRHRNWPLCFFAHNLSENYTWRLCSSSE